jgi:hypothetical protein
MLRQKGTGRPYHYSEHLMRRDDMKEVFMTRAEILAAKEGILGEPIAVVAGGVAAEAVAQKPVEKEAQKPAKKEAAKPALSVKPVQKARPVVKKKKPVVATRKPDVVDPDSFTK